MFLLEKISNNFAAKIATTLNLDKDREEVIAYGTYNLLQTLWTTLAIIIFGILFGTLYSILIIAFTVASMRKYSGGAHATSPNRCTLIIVLVFGVLSLLIKYTIPYVNTALVVLWSIISFVFTYVILFKLCPVDSPNKPIKKPETRLKLRKASFKILFLFYFALVILWIIYFKMHVEFLLIVIASISVGMFWQSLTMTSLGHLIINKMDTSLQKIKLMKGGNEE